MHDLNFTTAGIPRRTRGDVFDALKDLEAMNLDGMEMEFVRGVWLTDAKARAIKDVNDLVLTAHSPYYVNLNANEVQKVEASKDRIFRTARQTFLAGGYSITFHSGYYLKSSPSEAYKNIKNALSDILERLNKENIKIFVRPELTGKESQFGSLQELISLGQDLGILPCIDFAHYYARSIGKFNSKSDFDYVLEAIENNLGSEAIKNMHVHLSGIAYTAKGESHHEPLNETSFNWKAVLESLHDYDAKGVVVCESPMLEDDAMIMKNYYGSLD